MNILLFALILLLAKNFTSQRGSSGSERLFSILKLAANAKECGLFDILKGDKPFSSLLSGEIPLENLMEVFSSFSSGETPPAPSPTQDVTELAGEEMGSVLRCFLDESNKFTG